MGKLLSSDDVDPAAVNSHNKISARCSVPTLKTALTPPKVFTYIFAFVSFIALYAFLS